MSLEDTAKCAIRCRKEALGKVTGDKSTETEGSTKLKRISKS